MKKFNLFSEKLIPYVKTALLAILVVVEILVFAQAITSSDGNVLKIVLVGICCVALAVVETVDCYAVKNFIARMVCFGIAASLLLAICIFTGNSLLSTLYCVVLTQIYMEIDEFKDKFILFGVSCGLYVISFVVGWVLSNAGTPLANSAVEITTGALIGLLVLSIDFIIVQFLLRYYRTNIELSKALKVADDSRRRLEEAYRQLSETAVYEERNRIAKDIHDNAGHSMTTVIMQTEAAKLLIDKDPAEAKQRIISANLQARNALEQMRESVHLLAGRSKSLTLKEAVCEIINQTEDGTEIKVRRDIDDIEVGQEVYLFICNSLKECLANGIRHGRATAFYIELKTRGDGIYLYVSDNGTGAKVINRGFGLTGICEKAAALGGTCTLQSEPDEGFEVKIVLPCGRTEVEND